MTDAAPQTVTEATAEPQAPPVPEEAAEQPYFVKKDGTPVTGRKRGPDGKFLPAPPAEAKAAEAKTETAPALEPKPEEEKQQRIGDAWREVKQARRELAARQASFESQQAEIARERESIAAERAEMRANLRGWLSKQGLSFRQLVEEDLKEQDQDPRERELRELRAEIQALKEDTDSRKKRETEAEKAAARQQELTEVAGMVEQNADQFPYLAAYGADRAAQELQAHFYHHLETTGERLDVFALFEQANQILADNARRLAAVGNGKQVAEEPVTAARAESRVGSRVATEPEETAAQAAPSTLTNRTAATRASAVKANLRPEERARAIGNALLRVREAR